MDWARGARIADAVVVGVLVAYGQANVWTTDVAAVVQDRPVHALLAAVATVPLFVRRHRPLLALLLCLGAGWLHQELGGESGVLWFGLCLSMYALGAHGSRRSLLIGGAVVAAAILSYDLPRLLSGAAVDEVLPAWFILAGLAGLGRWIRYRGRETRQLAARAEIAERTRAEHAARAVADERARIARELHDLVAHSMGVIVIQAQAGQRMVDADPAAARSAFESIETAGRQGLAEMRRLLHLLTATEDRSVTPQPSLRELDDLVARVRAAGVPVEVHSHGDLGGLPAGVDLAAYRIVQEALTNVLKHAGPASVTVRLALAGGALDVEVCDDGRQPVAVLPAGGHGLVGMTERASLYGGSVETGPVPGGGFRVHARLAVDGVPA
jgi:signal transduction histidine kinase